MLGIFDKCRDFIALARPHQYSKNLFILAPAFFGYGQYNLSEVWGYLVGVFFAFCLICSGIYSLNDVIDKPQDIAHPSKSLRPIASGKISAFSGVIFGILLIFIGGGGQ